MGRGLRLLPSNEAGTVRAAVSHINTAIPDPASNPSPPSSDISSSYQRISKPELSVLDGIIE